MDDKLIKSIKRRLDRNEAERERLITELYKAVNPSSEDYSMALEHFAEAEHAISEAAMNEHPTDLEVALFVLEMRGGK